MYIGVKGKRRSSEVVAVGDVIGGVGSSMKSARGC